MLLACGLPATSSYLSEQVPTAGLGYHAYLVNTYCISISILTLAALAARTRFLSLEPSSFASHCRACQMFPRLLAQTHSVCGGFPFPPVGPELKTQGLCLHSDASTRPNSRTPSLHSLPTGLCTQVSPARTVRSKERDWQGHGAKNNEKRKVHEAGVTVFAVGTDVLASIILPSPWSLLRFWSLLLLVG